VDRPSFHLLQFTVPACPLIPLSEIPNSAHSVLAKTSQWMVHVDQLLKVDLKQLPLWRLRFTFGAYRVSQLS
jgi:hypothetical protein